MSFTKDFLVHKIEFMVGTLKYGKSLWRMTNQELEDLIEVEMKQYQNSRSKRL